MLNFIKTLIPIIAFFLLNAITVKTSKNSFGTCLPLTLTISTLLLYISQFIFNTFYIGLYVLIGFAILSIVLLILNIKNKDFLKQYLSIGFISCLIIFLFVLFIDYKRCFSAWDEFSHWGKMIKELLRLDSFYSVEESQLLVHKEYPPFVSIFEMLWCMLVGEYSEANVTMAIHFFELILFVPVILEEQKNENLIRNLIKCITHLFFTVLIILYFDSSHKFNYIYTDIFMLLYYVYLILLVNKYFNEKNFTNFIFILIILVGLSLIKQMAIAFILLIWFYFTLKELISNDNKKQVVINSIVVLAIPFLSMLLWKIYTNNLQLVGQFDLPENCIGNFVNIVLGGGNSVQKETYAKYINYLFSEQINIGIIKLSYFSSAILAIALLAVLYFVFKDEFDKKQFVSYVSLFVLGSVCYALLMCFMYMFCFSETEMLGLASFHRYMTCYMTSEYLMLFALLVKLINIKSFKYSVAISVLIMIVLAVINLNTIYSNCWNQYTIYNENYKYYRDAAESIMNNTEDGSKIYTISDGQTYMFLNYYFSNRNVFEISDSNNQPETGDYIYVDDVNYCNNTYTYLENIKNGFLYKIISNTGTYELERIDCIEIVKD